MFHYYQCRMTVDRIGHFSIRGNILKYHHVSTAEPFASRIGSVIAGSPVGRQNTLPCLRCKLPSRSIQRHPTGGEADELTRFEHPTKLGDSHHRDQTETQDRYGPAFPFGAEGWPLSRSGSSQRLGRLHSSNAFLGTLALLARRSSPHTPQSRRPKDTDPSVFYLVIRVSLRETSRFDSVSSLEFRYSKLGSTHHRAKK